MLGSLRRGLSSVEGPVSRSIDDVFVQEQLALFGACMVAHGPRCFAQCVLDRLKMGRDMAGMAVCLRNPCDPIAHCTRTTTRHLIRLDHGQASSHTSPSLARMTAASRRRARCHLIGKTGTHGATRHRSY